MVVSGSRFRGSRFKGSKFSVPGSTLKPARCNRTQLLDWSHILALFRDFSTLNVEA
jgi:hypothetical protein